MEVGEVLRLPYAVDHNEFDPSVGFAVLAVHAEEGGDAGAGADGDEVGGGGDVGLVEGEFAFDAGVEEEATALFDGPEAWSEFAFLDEDDEEFERVGLGGRRGDGVSTTDEFDAIG